MNIFTKIKSWNKLVNFIRIQREDHKIGCFEILTTGNEIIVHADRRHSNIKKTLG